MKKLTITGKIILETQKVNNEPAKVDIQELLVTILRTPATPERGANFDEMMAVSGLQKKLKKAIDAKANDILIEGDEFNLLVSALRGFRFTMNDPAIGEWVKSIIDLKDVPVEEKK